MSSCEVQWIITDFPQESLYRVILKTPFLKFFTKTRIFENLTEEQVQNLKIPVGKCIYGFNVPTDVFPGRGCAPTTLPF